ncbi:glycosyltransferase [Corynebacterium renale]|uniref:GT2 family glycosyltransferase n=1 Tax=Corynebacterium renale TaxID=1724 RepID=A0A2A9DLB0_9CORY|nr:glycosyltransferase [Corynebacterium renale]PFG27374.1 GT2 family glycosyltransferase [Corynebacterium renale]SQI23539.1 glycosyl transferase family protein [Corynebacterium renale]
MTSLACLITAYRGTNADDFLLALESLRDQTRPADEHIIVFDGPVAAEVAAAAESVDLPGKRIERLDDNVGSGLASAAGAAHVTAEFLARLDSDDIAAPERFATQLRYFAEHPHVDVLSTAMQEFDDATFRATASLEAAAGKIRRLPETHAELAKYAKINSPINNPSLMLRTSTLRAAGGYRHVPRMEDYDLAARALARGAVLHNLPEPLTWFRTSPDQLNRRTDGMWRAEARMQANLVRYGLISPPRAALNFVVRSAYRALPAGVLRRVNQLLFNRTR